MDLHRDGVEAPAAEVEVRACYFGSGTFSRALGTEGERLPPLEVSCPSGASERRLTSTTHPIILCVESWHLVCVNIHFVHACRLPAPSVVSLASFPLRRDV